jgi:hypothetical protein
VGLPESRPRTWTKSPLSTGNLATDQSKSHGSPQFLRCPPANHRSFD